MELLLLVGAGVVLYVVLKAYLKTTTKPKLRQASSVPQSRTPKSDPAGRQEWLNERWAMAEQEQYRGTLFPDWFFHPITEHQAARLEREGHSVPRGMTKGQASDLIGLSEAADENDLAVLKHFKKSTARMSESRARHEVGLLFLNDENKNSWERRPASARRLEFFKFIGLKTEPGLSETDARERQRIAHAELASAGDERAMQWDCYERILEEFDDADFREGVDIKRPSYRQLRSAIDRLLAQGKTWEEMADDPEALAERLLEDNPTLEK